MMPRALLLLVVAIAAGASARGELTAVDGDGVTVALATPATRIVSLAPSNTEIVFALGAGDALVGVTTLCDYPPAARDKPALGDLMSINVERVLAARPDLVLAHRVSPESLRRQLRAYKVPVYTLAPRSVGDTLDEIRTVGLLCGRVEAASALCEALEARIAAVREVVRAATESPRVYYGGLEAPMWAAGANTFVDELIRWSGGTNVCAALGDFWQLVPPEQILARNPAVALTGLKADRNTPAERERILSRLRADPVWSRTDAVRQGRVHFVDEDWTARDGPRLIDAFEAIARAVQPGCFSSP